MGTIINELSGKLSRNHSSHWNQWLVSRSLQIALENHNHEKEKTTFNFTIITFVHMSVGVSIEYYFSTKYALIVTEQTFYRSVPVHFFHAACIKAC